MFCRISNPPEQKSENQRIQLQLREENQPQFADRQKWDFLHRKPVGHLFCLQRQFKNVEMKEGKGLEMKRKVFFGRKSETIGELYLAAEIVAATFRLEMYCNGMVFMHFMRLDRRSQADTARELTARPAIMESHVPAYRDEQHHKGHQKRTNLQKSFFHGAKIMKICIFVAGLGNKSITNRKQIQSLRNYGRRIP